MVKNSKDRWEFLHDRSLMTERDRRIEEANLWIPPEDSVCCGLSAGDVEWEEQGRLLETCVHEVVHRKTIKRWENSLLAKIRKIFRSIGI